MNGILINIDGSDGSGKGTQTKLLIKRLRREKIPVKTIEFPRHGNPAACTVDRYLLGKYGSIKEVGPYRASILYAVDRYDASFIIKQWLAADFVVIVDRYVLSNLAHQGSNFSKISARKNFWQWNLNLEFNIFKIPQPDLSIVLRVAPQISYKLIAQKKPRAYLKGKKRDITEKNKGHLQATEKIYRALAKLPHTKLIDCSPANQLLSIKEIHQKIWTIVKKRLGK